MYIANATYTSQEFGLMKLAVSTEDETSYLREDRGDTIRIHYSKPIADAVMKAASHSQLPVDFTCNGVHYTLLKYTARPEERFFNKYRKNHVVRKSRIERGTNIFVCSERCRCTSCFGEYGFDSLENVCGVVKTRDNPARAVEIDVQHCTHCGGYFIDKESLAAYEEKYGLLNITKRHITGNEETRWQRTSVTYKENTILSRNGYSTRLFTTQRQAILSQLIERGVSKAELKDILTRFISQRSGRCPAASVCWRADLDYLNNYGLAQQGIVRFA